MKKEIIFSNHALIQMLERGVVKDEVVESIEMGEVSPAKKGRNSYRKNFSFENTWGGKFYRIKQVMPVVVEENDHNAVVTVFAFYF